MTSKIKSWCLIVSIVIVLSFTIMYNIFQNQPHIPIENYAETLRKIQDRFVFISQQDQLQDNRVLAPTGNTTNMTHVQEWTSDKNDTEVCGNCRDLKPIVAIAPREWHMYPDKTWEGLQLPALTLEPMGRFGNIMGEYATLYALSKTYNVSVRLLVSMKKTLIKAFPGLAIPLIPEGTEKKWKTLERLASGKYANIEAAAAGLLGPHPFKGSGWPFQIQLFHAYCCEIRKEFTFSTQLQSEVREFWQRKLKGRSLNGTEITLIGIHVRRTDYVKKMSEYHSKLPNDAYFQRAIDYYRNKFQNSLFVAASDDFNYIRSAFKDFKDVIYAPGKFKEQDMAILASCNHSIITVGSFGFWTGYLTGGEVLYPDLFYNSVYPFSRSMYELSQLDFFTPIPVD